MTSSDGNDDKRNISDNMSSVCGYRDVNEFSQVAKADLYSIASYVVAKINR